MRQESANLTIRGVVAAVPGEPVTNAELDAAMGNAHAARAVRLTGVQKRHRITEAQAAFRPTESLGLIAAERLLANLGWEASSLSALIFVTQTPGVDMPSGAHMLHDMLGLPDDCVPLQANYACAGYVYGLWLAGMLHAGRTRRVLLIVGDTISTRCAPQDSATTPVFGDCVTATAIECGPYERPAAFVLGSGGEGWAKLSMQPGEPMTMDGTAVFNFTLRVVPALLDAARSGREPDLYLFHQANRFMLQHLLAKAGIAPQIAPMNLDRFGNTSSASIPLLMCDLGLRQLVGKRVRMVGFGAGWTWGAATTDLEGLECAELIQV